MELKQKEFPARSTDGGNESPEKICKWINDNSIEVISICFDFNCVRWVVFYREERLYTLR